jgi:hypothetical protein
MRENRRLKEKRSTSPQETSASKPMTHRKDLGQRQNRGFPVPKGPSISPALVEIEFRATGDAPVSRSIANDISECGNLY